MQCLCWQELEDWLGSVVHNGVTLCLCISFGPVFGILLAFFLGVFRCLFLCKKKKRGGGGGLNEMGRKGMKPGASVFVSVC